jgi:hypothetical protein
MNRRASTSLTLITFAVSGVLLAQSALVQLGLTDATARNFLLDEIKSPASSRRNDIVVTGNRAFLKLPPFRPIFKSSLRGDYGNFWRERPT